MQIISVAGEKRAKGGRHANERVRRKGYVPAIVYGHGEAPESVSLSLHDLEIALEAMTHVVSVRMDGAEKQYLVKDIQFDHLQRRPLHVDLMRVDPNERVHIRVPIELKGTPKGAAEGGQLIQTLSDLHIDCLLLQIPEAIRHSVLELGLNQSVHVRDLQLPEGIKVLSSPDDLIAIVRLPRAVEEAPAAAAAAPAEGTPTEPELIKKPKPVEGEEEKE
ncbi:50S ribosomal protein L25 [Phycisphaerae bacterium RAS1]|nr:50S ribosomal protein L25 [Phycisphaerae bacterium RAS1]